MMTKEEIKKSQEDLLVIFNMEDKIIDDEFITKFKEIGSQDLHAL